MTPETTGAAIAAIADALIPPARGFLAGSEAGIPGSCLDRALRARPDLRDSLSTAAAVVLAGADAAELLADWSKSRPQLFDDVFLLVRGAYFLNEDVLRRFHYDGITAHPLSDAIPPDYTDLLGPVLGAGPRYRAVLDGTNIGVAGGKEPVA